MSETKHHSKISNNEYEDLIKKNFGLEKTKEKSIVHGKVVYVDKESVVVDVGLKSEGRIPISEFVRPGKEPEIKIGDKIEVFLDKVDGINGETKLSREKAIKQAAWNKLQECFNDGKTVQGVPFNRVKGGLSVDLDGVLAFLPGSQIDSIKSTNDNKELLNKPLDLMILKMDKYRGNIVVSRKAISDIELQEKRSKLLSKISEGSILEGKVKNITDYGAFIDLGGIDGLVHVTDISWKRINHPSDELVIGSEVKVIVLKYDEKITRLSLGIKQLSKDPWEELDNKFKLEENYKGKITNITDNGVTIEIEENFDGFISTQDLTWLKKPPHPSKLVQLNDELEVKLTEIDKEKRKLNFSLKILKENPWDKLKDKFKIGDIVETEIVNKVDFGIFVKVFEEIDGMVHISDLDWDEKESTNVLSSIKKGDKIKVKILDIDIPKERVSLSVKHLTKSPVEDFLQKNPLRSIISGKIASIDEKGITVDLGDKIDGYIRKNNLSNDKKEQKIDRFAIGETVDAMIMAYDDKIRKINLSIKDKEMHEEKEALDEFGSSDSGASLGDILGDVLKKKNQNND